MWGDLKGDTRYCYGCHSSDHWGCDCPHDPAGGHYIGPSLQEQIRQLEERIKVLEDKEK